MIVLDANVLSETLRPQPDAKVLAWLEAQSRGASLATRHTRDFTDCGIELIDPWNAG